MIELRQTRKVPVAPHGTLSDYVPFYFTPCSMMLYNIVTGYGNVTKRERSEIAFFVASVRKLKANGCKVLFTNGHAYPKTAWFYSLENDLDQVDWKILQNRDFKHDPENDPDKTNRYQAEALVHKEVPLNLLEGLACYDEEVKIRLNKLLDERGLALPVATRPSWYFQP